MNGQLALGWFIGVSVIILGLMFSLPTLLPDVSEQVQQYYKQTEISMQTQWETMASLQGLPQLSFVAYASNLAAPNAAFNCSALSGTSEATCEAVTGCSWDSNTSICSGTGNIDGNLTIVLKNVGGGIAKNNIGVMVVIKDAETLRPVYTTEGSYPGDLEPGNQASINITLPAAESYNIEQNESYQVSVKMLYYNEDGHQLKERESAIIRAK